MMRRRTALLAFLLFSSVGCGADMSGTLDPSYSMGPAATDASRSADPQEHGVETEAPGTETPAPERETPAPAPPPATEEPPARLPAGSVPSVLVGDWTGGEGAKTGEYLRIAGDGSYRRGRNGFEPFRGGVLVARGQGLVANDVDGSQQRAQWTYNESAGIEVLGLTFDDGSYYSYVRV
jgi:hypothetical protein